MRTFTTGLKFGFGFTIAYIFTSAVAWTGMAITGALVGALMQ